MDFRDRLLPEYDREMGVTRKLLERVPDGKLAWRPHEKSMTMGRLATHLAELPGRMVKLVQGNSYDMTGPYAPHVAASRAEILQLFDESVATARKEIAAKTDAEWMAPWTFKREGKDLFTMPKAAMIRTMLMNHTIHHRAQLGVYLRLNDIPVPSVYGPSADEG